MVRASFQTSKQDQGQVEKILQSISATLESTGEANIAERTELLRSLAVSLRTQPMKCVRARSRHPACRAHHRPSQTPTSSPSPTPRFVIEFIEQDGLILLLDLLAAMDYRARQTEEHRAAVRCISALMNNVVCLLRGTAAGAREGAFPLPMLTHSPNCIHPHIHLPAWYALCAVPPKQHGHCYPQPAQHRHHRQNHGLFSFFWRPADPWPPGCPVRSLSFAFHFPSFSPFPPTKVYEILGAICLIPDGHRKVMDALAKFSKFAGERTRFQTIVSDLARDTQTSADLDIKSAALALINATIFAGPGKVWKFGKECRGVVRLSGLFCGPSSCPARHSILHRQIFSSACICALSL